tara:strand:- start:63 stop:299 length:237 start_codon:yes stop_codon:yes gene_type:complete
MSRTFIPNTFPTKTEDLSHENLLDTLGDCTRLLDRAYTYVNSGSDINTEMQASLMDDMDIFFQKSLARGERLPSGRRH